MSLVVPLPTILVPTYNFLATDNPPERTTGAVPRAEASVTLVKVTLPFAVSVVNAAVLGLEEPIDELVMVLFLMTQNQLTLPMYQLLVE